MAMTKETIAELLTRHPAAIFAISLDNNKTLFLNYSDSAKVTDLRLETVKDCDFLVVSRRNPHPDRPINFETWHNIENIQWIGIMKDDSIDYRPDPMLFK